MVTRSEDIAKERCGARGSYTRGATIPATEAGEPGTGGLAHLCGLDCGKGFAVIGGKPANVHCRARGISGTLGAGD